MCALQRKPATSAQAFEGRQDDNSCVGRTSDVVVLVDVVLQRGEPRQSQDEAEEGKGQPEEGQHCRNGPSELAGEAAAAAPCTGSHALPLGHR